MDDSLDNNKSCESAEEDEINLIDYFVVIFKYRRMILSISVVAVVITAIFIFSSPKIYSATASIVPPLSKENSLTGKFGGAQHSLIAEVIGIAEFSDIYASILSSRVVGDAIIDRFDLMNVYKDNKHKSSVRKKLEKNTHIVVSDEGIVNITVEDKDPNRAAAMANAYVEELDRQNKRLSSGQATSKKVFLGTRLAEIEEKLSKIENILSREARTQEMLFEMLTREYEIAKIEEAKNMPTIQVLDKAIVSEVRMARGTVRKAMLAGVVFFMLAVFLAFARESFAKINSRTKEQLKFSFKPREKSCGNSTLSDFEDKRKIIAEQRKRVQKNIPKKSIEVS